MWPVADSERNLTDFTDIDLRQLRAVRGHWRRQGITQYNRMASLSAWLHFWTVHCGFCHRPCLASARLLQHIADELCRRPITLCTLLTAVRHDSRIVGGRELQAAAHTSFSYTGPMAMRCWQCCRRKGPSNATSLAAVSRRNSDMLAMVAVYIASYPAV